VPRTPTEGAAALDMWGTQTFVPLLDRIGHERRQVHVVCVSTGGTQKMAGCNLRQLDDPNTLAERMATRLRVQCGRLNNS
jgi:hypothetical protein